MLTAFEDVENDLSALRILSEQAKALDVAVHDALRGTEIALAEFQAGTVDYTTVVWSMPSRSPGIWAAAGPTANCMIRDHARGLESNATVTRETERRALGMAARTGVPPERSG